MMPDPATIAEFHRSIGHAITRWQYVETGLYIVSHCMLGAEHKMASTVFFHIESARQKVTITDKLCRIGLPQDGYQRHWLPLKKEIIATIEFRNALAHFDTMMFDPSLLASDLAGVTKHPIMLTPNSHDPASDGDIIKCLHVEQIQQLAVGFRDLAERLLVFVPAHVPNWRERSKSLPPETLQILDAHERKAKPPLRRQPWK